MQTSAPGVIIVDVMLRAAVLTALAFSGLPLAAQPWSVLNGLTPGNQIKVRDSSGRDIQGAFASVTADSITLKARNAEVSLERSRVRRVQVRSASRRAVKAVIGGGIGLAVGAVVDGTLGAYYRNETGQSSGQRAAMYIAPVALFGGLAAAFPAYRTVYRAP